MICRLCNTENSTLFSKDKQRTYYQCHTCKLVFVPENNLPSSFDEKERYNLHKNTITDKGYVKFLARFYEPLILKIDRTKTGLDFGSGPNPVLTEILKSKGFDINHYDLYYHNSPGILKNNYDYITMTEVCEHFHHPMREFNLLNRLLNPNGILAIMTQLLPNQNDFKNWWYKNDFTHVCFYSMDSLGWIAKKYNYQIEQIDKDIIFLIKKEP